MSKPLTPTVSICIPTYCGENYLGAAIDSVLIQDFTDFELIIIDDNSPDQTATLVANYHDNRIRYIKNSENLGPEGNWNKCLLEAKGKYFKLLPHDDVLAPNCISRQVNILENDINKSLSVVFCARKIIGHDGKTITSRGYPRAKEGMIAKYTLIKNCIRMGTNLVGEPGAVLFRKELADKIGHFDGSIPYIIDLDFWFKLLLQGDAYYMKEPLAAFRVASGSWSVAIGHRQRNDFKRFIGRCQKKPEYNLTIMDYVTGVLMSNLNNYLRLLFYRFYVKK